jgi:hypothetical protein
MTKHHFPVKPETWCAFVRQPQDGSIFGPQQPGGARYLVTPPHPMRYIGLHPATEVGGLKVYTADNEGAGGNGYATLCQGQILDLGGKMEEFEIDRLYMSSGNIMLRRRASKAVACPIPRTTSFSKHVFVRCAHGRTPFQSDL